MSLPLLVEDSFSSSSSTFGALSLLPWNNTDSACAHLFSAKYFLRFLKKEMEQEETLSKHGRRWLQLKLPNGSGTFNFEVLFHLKNDMTKIRVWFCESFFLKKKVLFVVDGRWLLTSFLCVLMKCNETFFLSIKRFLCLIW